MNEINEIILKWEQLPFKSLISLKILHSFLNIKNYNFLQHLKIQVKIRLPPAKDKQNLSFLSNWLQYSKYSL